ncbi:MAG: lasso peptide biosynthesis B2 protein, partial [Niameybacter sp.]
TPWESKCLVQAMVAQYLLKRRRIATTLYLGVAKGSEGELKAHAWLRCGQMIVTGDGARRDYKEVARFANLAA